MTQSAPEPSPDVLALQVHLKAPTADVEFLTDVLTQATTQVDTYLGEARTDVPPEVLAGAVREVAVELYSRRSIRHGIATYTTADGQLSPVRVNRDPLAAAYPLLARYVPAGLA